MTDLIGVNVSKPFAVDQGRPCFFTLSWILRAVKSIPRAKSTTTFESAKYAGNTGSRLTISSNVIISVCLRYIASALPNDNTKFN